jgi:hypothetical protein
MIRTAGHLSVSALCRVALGALAVVLAVPEDSRAASCGHYVLVGGDLTIVDHHPIAHVGWGQSPAVPAAPCRGPGCSARDSAPAVPAAPSRVDSPQQWLLSLVLGEAIPGTGWPSSASQHLSLRPLHLAGGVFRPPCAR